ncbi:MAG: hypothetical protein ACR2PK_09880 [Acidimicrobiales bacterium]
MAPTLLRTAAMLVAFAVCGVFAITVWLGGAVAAQDDPAIVITPTSVAEPGTVDVTVVGSGWTTDAAILILPCDAPASGLPEDVDPSLCVTDQLTTVNPRGGSFETVLTVVVAPTGLAIAATDSDQTERAVAIITVTQPPPDPDPEPPDSLPETGTSGDLTAIAAASLVLAGVLLVTQTRTRASL